VRASQRRRFPTHIRDGAITCGAQHATQLISEPSTEFAWPSDGLFPRLSEPWVNAWRTIRGPRNAAKPGGYFGANAGSGSDRSGGRAYSVPPRTVNWDDRRDSGFEHTPPGGFLSRGYRGPSDAHPPSSPRICQSPAVQAAKHAARPTRSFAPIPRPVHSSFVMG
jgi:hypothetical protein